MVDYKIEVITLPVTDVDRAKEFYGKLGFREDLDYQADGDDFRVVHFTPPGSRCSIIIGNGLTTSAPGTVQDIHLIVDDIEAARADLVSRGADVSEIFHDEGGVFHHAGTEKRVPGPQPDRRSYGSFASFKDPDGNGFVLQEVTERIPGR